MRRTILPVLILVCGAASATAEPIEIRSQPITTFGGVEPGGKAGALIFEGGLNLTSDAAAFSSLSGLTFPDLGERFIAVSDKGFFVTGTVDHTESGQPAGILDGRIEEITNSGGDVLPRAFARDAEAVQTIRRDGRAAAVRVGFEHLTRVADFDLVDGVPTGAARVVAIPEWLERMRTNTSIESLCIAPPASPVSGSTLLIVEADAGDGTHRAFLLGQRDRGELALEQAGGFNPTDCAFLPNGDLLVLERGTVLISFVMQVRRFKAADVHRGGRLTGEVILSGGGADIDNMEGLGVHRGADGSLRISLVSDNNENGWERTILLEFSLPGE